MSKLSHAPDRLPEAPFHGTIAGPAGTIELVVSPPLSPARGAIAIVCQPHPLHGGTMNNKVVTTTERALRELGLPTLRFNFRGVGASEGAHDYGVGEQDDLAAVAAYARGLATDAALWLAGFSFGSYVAAARANALDAAQLVSLAPPVGRWDFDAIDPPRCPWLAVIPEADEVVDADAAIAWFEARPAHADVVKMPATSHFFHGKLTDLRGVLADALGKRVPA